METKDPLGPRSADSVNTVNALTGFVIIFH